MKTQNPAEKIEQLERAVPVSTYGMRMDLKRPMVITNPEKYQAFYGILRGDPDVFGIKKTPDLFLDLQLLFPESPGSASELTLQIFAGEKLLEQFYCKPTDVVQEVAGYRFSLGKDFRSTIKDQTLTLIVRNADNMGKYVLTVGNIYVQGDFTENHKQINKEFQRSIGPETPSQIHWFILLAFILIFVAFAVNSIVGEKPIQVFEQYETVIVQEIHPQSPPRYRKGYYEQIHM